VNDLYHAIERCRICQNSELVPLLDLGTQCLTGRFPRKEAEDAPAGPLALVKCHGSDDACGLVQLQHSYDGSAMYGNEYGYRSSLNRSMIDHLGNKIRGLARSVSLGKGDIVLDIGSNDGTSLSFYPADGPSLIGIDPTASKFARFYRPDIRVVPQFFSAASFRAAAGGDSAKAKIVTSIAMFYDLDDPLKFVQDVADILADDGIWHFEQSYMPAMLQANAYDTVCHEHVEYYALRQIDWMLRRAGLQIVDVEQNDVNGGSFAVTAGKSNSGMKPSPRVAALLREEEAQGLSSLLPYQRFAQRVMRHKVELPAKIRELRKQGKRVVGLGASTKGNVLLQFCKLGAQDIDFIAEVNEDKFGCVTPGTRIPIISEADGRRLRPDVFLVMPWHFRSHFLKREEPFLRDGGKLLFPLPEIDLVSL
jgi:hypothetical protein